MTSAAIMEVLDLCDDPTSVALATGARFVRKLPGPATLNYLHSLYAPLPPDMLTAMEDDLGGRLPQAFADFLLGANGARLFVHALHLFGYATGQSVSRSTNLEDQEAISICWKNDLLRNVQPVRWADGWRTVGSLAGWTTQLDIQLHHSGACSLRHGDAEGRDFQSFDALLREVVPRLQSCFDCTGPIDPTYGQLEAIVSSLTTTQWRPVTTPLGH
jgi:hypothetical protein